jgi:hypothetical protein
MNIIIPAAVLWVGVKFIFNNPEKTRKFIEIVIMVAKKMEDKK